MFAKKSSLIILCIAIILLILAFFVRNPERKKSPEGDPRRNANVLAIEKALPAVVNISTERVTRDLLNSSPFQRLFEQFLRSQEDRKSYSLGSGFLIDPSGLIVTNAHVVERATRIIITLNNGRSCEGAVIASDMLNDIALLKLEKKIPGLRVIQCDPSNKYYLGETVITVGNPFGLDSSISVGSLSGEGRRFTYEGQILFSDILQTDAIVYPGNSGGPLINIEGQVIGMNMSVYQDAPGIGFAIPFARVENVLAKWMLPERFSDCVLGIVPGWNDRKNAVIVSDILRSSPAEKTKLPKNCVILEFNGEKVTDLLKLSRCLIRLKKGENVRLKTSAGIFNLKTESYSQGDVLLTAKRKLSLDLIPLNHSLAKELGYPVGSGLIVGDILPDTAPGIRRGDLLVRLGEININNVRDLAAALKGLHYNDSVTASLLSRITIQDHPYLIRRSAIIKIH